MSVCKIRGEKLRDYGIRQGLDHPRGKYPFETVEQVRYLYAEQVPLKVISKITEVPVNTINDWIYRNRRTEA